MPRPGFEPRPPCTIYVDVSASHKIRRTNNSGVALKHRQNAGNASYLLIVTLLSPIRCGLVVRIPGFHPGGPGSIPGTGTPFYLCLAVICRAKHGVAHW